MTDDSTKEPATPKPDGDGPASAKASDDDTSADKKDTGTQPGQDQSFEELRGETAQLSSVRSGKIISEMIARFDSAGTVNVFQGDLMIEGDFLSGDGGRRPGARRASKTRLDPATESANADNYARPADFDIGVTMLNDNNLTIFSGRDRTGRHARATATLVEVMRRNEMDLELYELTGHVLGNMTWRVPQRRAGFVINDHARGSGKPPADAVDDKWLGYAAERLTESQSFLVVVTGPVGGTLATAPGRPEYVLEDMELPDPMDIVLRVVTNETALSEAEVTAMLDATDVDDILDERDDPRFAVRVAKAVVDAVRAGADPGPAIEALNDPIGRVREWLGGDPDLADVAFVVATAVLEGSSYLKVADAGVALYRALSSASGATTPRYLRRLGAERGWIEPCRQPADPEGPQVLRFQHAGLPGAVLATVWSELDGAREKILHWLTDLAKSTDVEIRTRAAGAAGMLATADFEHGLHSYFLPWATDQSIWLRQSAASGIGFAGNTGGHSDIAWIYIERWAAQVLYRKKDSKLATTAILAAGGPLGVDDPARALRVVRALLERDEQSAYLGSAAQSCLMLLAAGRTTSVLEALLDWTDGKSTDQLVRASLFIFSLALIEGGEPDSTNARRPMLLDVTKQHEDLLPELWGRAIANEPVRPLALDALEFWVRWADQDPTDSMDVLMTIAGIAERGDVDHRRVELALRKLAEDAENPSDSAATFHGELIEAGSMT
jgi:hypothetical protein